MSNMLARDRVVRFDVTTPTNAALITTLSADVTTTTQTSISLNSPVAVNGVYIIVGIERMFVLSGAGTSSVTVQRAAWGTTAGVYFAGAIVYRPGFNNFTLKPISTIPNKDFHAAKIDSSINYQLITCASGDSFPGGSTTIILADNSASLGNVSLLAPGSGNTWMQTSGGSTSTVTGTISVGSGGGIGTSANSLADKASFVAGFGAPILPGQTYPIKHIIQNTCKPGSLYALLTNPPASGDFIFDVQVSPDGGSTWSSILADPITIPAGCNTVVSSSSFAAGVGFASGNMLQLVVISSGLAPAFSSGFSCTLQLNSTNIVGYDRANFSLGFTRNVPLNTDLGVYFITARKVKPYALFVNVQNPPQTGDVSLDIQSQNSDSSWSSLLPVGAPLTIPSGVSSVISTTTFNPDSVALLPGTLVRPYLLSGPIQSGMGYNISLQFEVTT